MSDLYAIIKATEKLERAYVRDAIRPEEYESTCEKLIQQFKVLSGSLKTLVGRGACVHACTWAPAAHVHAAGYQAMLGSGLGPVTHCKQALACHICTFGMLGTLIVPLTWPQVPDVERFMSDYNMQCPMAATRLLYSGLPATIEHKSKQRWVRSIPSPCLTRGHRVSHGKQKVSLRNITVSMCRLLCLVSHKGCLCVTWQCWCGAVGSCTTFHLQQVFLAVA